ncbi:MAG: AsmA family protein, partial [Bacteroidales bacterium]|nr:AsmA family protein [Bacteroidales bacterium]
MKKLLKISGIVLAVILVLLLVLPFAFQGKIKELVIKEANKELNAKLAFDDLSLSLIRNFPKASLSLENIILSGVDEFEKDTLLKAENVAATVDVMSLFGDTG